MEGHPFRSLFLVADMWASDCPVARFVPQSSFAAENLRTYNYDTCKTR